MNEKPKTADGILEEGGRSLVLRGGSELPSHVTRVLQRVATKIKKGARVVWDELSDDPEWHD